MNEYIMFVDTETSGLPKNWDHPNEDWPYVIQLSWIVYSKQGVHIKEEDHYIYDERIVIDPESEKIHHITKAVLEEKGERRLKVLKRFLRDLRQYNPLLVGHLIEFDKQMLSVALQRAGLKNTLDQYPTYCTMKTNAHYMRLTNHLYPKLNELYWSLFGHDMPGQHNALSDCRATAACFFELVRREEITEDIIKKQQLQFKKKASKKGSGCGLSVVLCFTLVFVLICYIW